MNHRPIDNLPFEITSKTKRRSYCRNRHGGQTRALRRESHRCAISHDGNRIQELFERVETVGTRLRDRHARALRRGDLINRHFVVASFARVELRFRHHHDCCARETNKRTLTRACARACAYRARRGDVARRKVRKFVAKKGRKTVLGRRDGEHIILQFYR